MNNTLQDYDLMPFPRTERNSRAIPAVVEAGVLQELALMNAVYDNMKAGVLTEEQAYDIMWILDSANNVFSEAAEIVFSESGVVYADILEECVVDNLAVIGRGVLPKKVIYESCKPDSIYNAPTWERSFFEDTTALGDMMNDRMDMLELELDIYKESYSAEGFEGISNIAYLETMDDQSGLTMEAYLETVTLAATITNSIPAEDGIAILSFLESVMIEAQAIPAMAPITTASEPVIQKQELKPAVLAPKKTKDATAMEAVANTLLNANGWYAMEAAKVYQHNTFFDAICKKLFKRISKYLKMNVKDDVDKSFNKGLNLHKDEYHFSFADLEEETSEKDVENFVRAAILSSGFKPIKNDKRVIQYTMDKNDITVTVEFDSVQLGISMNYTKNKEEEKATEESVEPIYSLEADNRMKEQFIHMLESAIEQDKYARKMLNKIDESSMYKKMNDLKDNWKESHHIEEAVDKLMGMLESGENVADDQSAIEAMGLLGAVTYVETACEAVLDAAEEAMTEASKEEIDEEMKPIIELLNRLGYQTKYSSAGYRKERSKDDRDKDGVYYGKLYTTARITFDGNYKFDKLPKGWYQNFNSDKTAIYVKPFTHNDKEGDPDEAFTKWKNEYMEALKDWAENLKEAKDTKADKEEEKKDE